MDGRQAMTLAGGSASYYIHRGGDGGSGSGIPYQPPGFRPVSSASIPAQSDVQGGSARQTFSVEQSHSNFNHGVNISVPQGVPSTEHVKKKRGRPRKYGPNGTMSLRLSPMTGTGTANSTPGSGSLSPRKGRGRPPGSGRKQQLAHMGEWMNDTAGVAFAPHVITVGVGEDVVAKMLSIAQQRPRALCILSGTGAASSVTLRQPASTDVSGTYEGRFQILCLSGSYLVAEEGGPRNRTGGMSASLSSPDGHVIGGAIAILVAASPVQVVLCSFVYGNGSSKTKIKEITSKGNDSNEDSETKEDDKLATPASAPASLSYTPSASGGWPVSSRPVDLKSPNTGIDLTRG